MWSSSSSKAKPENGKTQKLRASIVNSKKNKQTTRTLSDANSASRREHWKQRKNDNRDDGVGPCFQSDTDEQETPTLKDETNMKPVSKQQPNNTSKTHTEPPANDNNSLRALAAPPPFSESVSTDHVESNVASPPQQQQRIIFSPTSARLIVSDSVELVSDSVEQTGMMNASDQIVRKDYKDDGTAIAIATPISKNNTQQKRWKWLAVYVFVFVAVTAIIVGVAVGVSLHNNSKASSSSSSHATPLSSMPSSQSPSVSPSLLRSARPSRTPKTIAPSPTPELLNSTLTPTVLAGATAAPTIAPFPTRDFSHTELLNSTLTPTVVSQGATAAPSITPFPTRNFSQS